MNVTCSYFTSLFIRSKSSGYGYVLGAFILLFIFFASYCNANTPDKVEIISGKRECNITSIFINAQQIAGAEVPAIICGDTVYLSVRYFFDLLKIKNAISPDFDSITGYFIDPHDFFIIDNVYKSIHYKQVSFKLNPEDILQAENDLFLQLDCYNKVFGLNCIFDLYNLSINLNTIIDLPAVKILQEEQIREQVKRLIELPMPDTSIKTSRPFFNMGALDWTITGTQQVNGDNNFRTSLSIGAVLAGGEINLGINYFNTQKIDEKQQYYFWRYANNKNRILKQVILGKVFPQSTASIFNPVIGVQLTNASTKSRQIFSNYPISGFTKPGWTVELYMNNILINFSKADDAGFYSFNIPMPYGNSVIKLRFCGPFGEKKEKEMNVFIPLNFIPPHQLEYTITSGMVEDNANSLYSRAGFNYGINKRITLGWGMEYLSSVPADNYMPFINTSVRLTSNLVVLGEYIYAVRARGSLLYKHKTGAQLTINYTNYERDQKAIIFNYLEERSAILSVPFHSKYLSGLSMVSINQIIFPNMLNYTTGQWLFTVVMRRVNLNVNTFMVPIVRGDALHFGEYIYSDWGLTCRLAKGLTIMPQVQYAYQDGKFISMKCRLEQYLLQKCYITLSYERHFNTPIYYLSAGVQYNMPFAKVGFTAARYNDDYLLMGSAHGNIVFDPRTNYLEANNRSQVGRGGITFLAYLDINGNGKKDANEHKVEGLNVKIRGGRVVHSRSDTLIHILDMEPYINYYIDLSQNSFEGVTWQIPFKTLMVNIMPNQLQLIEIPVNVKNEVTGTVHVDGHSEWKNRLKVKICFYTRDNTFIGYTYTDNEGYYSYTDLLPGSYFVRIDNATLMELHAVVTPTVFPLTIKGTENGEIIENVDFTIK